MIPLRDANPTRTIPIVTILLVAVNVVVWLIQLTFQARGELEAFVYSFAMIPAVFSRNPLGESWTLLTSMFMHGSWGHLLGNLLYLWIFGDNVEDQLGRGRFLIYYLATGIVASLAQLAINPASPIPNVGASGAIAGVMGGYLVMFPRARVVALVGYFVTRVPAVLVLVLWFVYQLFAGFGSLGMEMNQGGIAFFAHIGGFVAGILLVLPFRRRRRTGAVDRDDRRLPPF